MKIFKKKFIIPTVIVLILLLIIIASVGSKKGPKEETATVKLDTVVQKISETGIVKRGEKLEIGFEISGIIKEISSKIGQIIKKGDVLGKLDNSQLIIQ